MSVKFPGVKVALVGDDGNAFYILGKVLKALRRAGISDDERDEFLDDARSGDYDHLLCVVMKWVEVS